MDDFPDPRLLARQSSEGGEMDSWGGQKIFLGGKMLATGVPHPQTTLPKLTVPGQFLPQFSLNGKFSPQLLPTKTILFRILPNATKF